MRPQRGEIWLIDFGQPVGHEAGGRRPGVVVSTDELNTSAAELMIVVPTTTSRRLLPMHIEIERGESGLDQTSYAKCEDIKSMSQTRSLHRLGRASDEVMFQIERSIGYLLEL